MDPLTLEQLQQALPDKVKKSLNPVLVQQINQTLSEPEFYESFRDNLVGYASVMKDGKFRIEQYIAAVKYVSYKLMGDSNILAYSKTFPDKIARFQAQGVSDKDIASYVTAYNKSKLVNLIFEQTLIPTWVLNQDLYQKAINHQAHLMLTARSEKVQSDAAAHLMSALKPPEATKVQLDVSHKSDGSIEALRQTTLALVHQQKRLLEAGAMNAREVAHSRLLIEGEAERVE